MARLVLDVCCGPRMMWFEKNDARVVFVDKRQETHRMPRPKRGTVEVTATEPAIVGDFTALPFAGESFALVVFDPPHFERTGKIGFLAQKYGWLPKDWRGMLCRGFAECFRVLIPNGVLIFKWTATDNSVASILALTPYAALFGHQSGKQMHTHWITFMKTDAPASTDQCELFAASEMARPGDFDDH